MSERGDAEEPHAVRDVSAVYSVEVEPIKVEDVPRGYKRTEVAVLPEDWGLKPLKELFKFSNGINADKAAYGHGTPFINVLEPITYSHIQTRNIPGKVEVAMQLVELYSIQSGDIVFNRTSETPNELGLAAVFLGQAAVVFGGFVIRARPTTAVLDPIYSGYGLRAALVRSQIISKGQGAVRANIGQESLRAVRVPVPPIHEQRAIANALSDADALIESLDRLIAKKRAIKQAAMQQLLTGQTRLPGFTGEWETKRLGEIVSFHKGVGLAKVELVDDGANPCIHYGELFTEYGEVIRNTKSRTNRALLCFKSLSNDVLMPTSDVTPNGLATASCIMKNGVILGGDILVIRSREGKIDGSFLAYKIRMDHSQIMQLVSGTTVFHIYGRDMANFVYEAPRIEEQRAIVDSLSAIDTEIEALERRRDKARQIKQGMMQELLTGRTRLVEPGHAA